MRTWRDEKPTQEQLKIIRDLEQKDGFGKFAGLTKGDAAEYISLCKWFKREFMDKDKI